MKHFLKQILISFLAIIIVAYLTQSINYHSDPKALVTAAFFLAFLNAFFKPLLKVLLVPINVITLGLLGWVVNVIILYLTTLLVTSFDVVPFSLSLGQVTLSFSLFFSYIAVAFFINLISRLVSWVID